MPRGGHNRKATHLKVIQGTLRPDRAVGLESKPRPVVAKLPKGLDLHARRAWRQLAPVLNRLGLLTELDTMAFTVLCDATARLQHARRRLRQVERAAKGVGLETLTLIRKAEVSVEQSEHGFRQLAAEFGMTPGARSRLDIQVPIDGGTDDEFEEFLRGGS